jgi:hypothetical protein
MSLKVDDLDVEVQSCIWWNDTASTCSTVGKIWRTDKRSLLSFLQLADALVPAFDDLANTNFEF